MLGKPKYDYDDVVKFHLKDENGKSHEVEGKIYIIDSYGTFEQNEEVSYDVMVDSTDLYPECPCLFKHIRESELILVYKADNK